MTLSMERPTTPNHVEERYDVAADSEGTPAPKEFDPADARAIGAKCMQGFHVLEGPISKANLLNPETGLIDFPHI